MDWELFTAISADELYGCQWTSKRKQQLAPGIVAFTQKFNSVVFFTTRLILSPHGARDRANALAVFIKVLSVREACSMTCTCMHCLIAFSFSQCLLRIGNLHSGFAVLSALLSVPIYRLKATWAVSTDTRTPTHITRSSCCHSFYAANKSS